MTNLFGSLDSDIWDFIGIWCLEFDISEYLNTRDAVSKDDLSVRYRSVEFHIWDSRIRCIEKLFGVVGRTDKGSAGDLAETHLKGGLPPLVEFRRRDESCHRQMVL